LSVFSASNFEGGVTSARLAGLLQAEVRIGDATALDLHDAAFDAAVSTQVYEYIADMPRAGAVRPMATRLRLDAAHPNPTDP
jgi:hypothetical protein